MHHSGIIMTCQIIAAGFFIYFYANLWCVSIYYILPSLAGLGRSLLCQPCNSRVTNYFLQLLLLLPSSFPGHYIGFNRKSPAMHWCCTHAVPTSTRRANITENCICLLELGIKKIRFAIKTCFSVLLRLASYVYCLPLHVVWLN